MEFPGGVSSRSFSFDCGGTPCTEYSIAKTVGVRNLEMADQLVCRTKEIIGYFNPSVWWIENPRTGLLKNRGLLDSCSFIDVDYCQFSDWGYKKPTRLWVSPSLSKVANMVCDPHNFSQMVDGKGDRRVHREHLGGKQMKVSTRQKESMPTALVNYLLHGVLFPPQLQNKKLCWKSGGIIAGWERFPA